MGNHCHLAALIVLGGKIMDYIKANKEAWEEVFPKHQAGYQFDIAGKILENGSNFLNDDTVKEFAAIGLKNKRVAQFCCNNGRELLSIMKLGAGSGVGFDIADNFIAEANGLAGKLNYPCEFVATNIYEISNSFQNQFDLLLITIGALCWFEDLDRFFQKAAMVLKDDGIVLINEQHPFVEMIARDGEGDFNPSYPKNIVYPYFRTYPWIENNGMDYIGGTTYPSKTFTSFTHPLSAIFNALIQNGIEILKFQEYDYDISNGFQHLNGEKLPLSYILRGKKRPNAI
jgi:ubiquinone/menaquinone biosynthesis C-methylase UbiE